MSSLAIILTALLFAGFVLLDVLSALPRIAGAMLGVNGIAYSFQVMANTLKRVLIVLYPPFLGVISYMGEYRDFILTIALSYLLGMVAVVACFLMKVKILAYLCRLLHAYGKSGKLWQAFRLSFFTSGGVNSFNVEAHRLINEEMPFAKLLPEIFYPATWIFFFYGASVFIINILAFRFPQYSPVILQTTGLFNAFGTIALAFYLDPKMSRIFELKENLPGTVKSVLFAHAVNIFIVSPVFFVFFLYFFR